MAKRTRGGEMNGSEFKNLQPGDWLWIYYAKDDDPNRVMIDGSVQVKSVFDGGLNTKDDEWNAPWADDVNMDDTSRGFAHYYHCEIGK